jgi:hypothetical protein
MLDEEVIERFPDDAGLREGFNTALPFSSGSSARRFKSPRIEKTDYACSPAHGFQVMIRIR